MKRALLGVSIAAGLVLGWAGAALAHPDVDEGKELMMAAEFERALEAFARAEEADDLTRDDLVQLLGARCLAYLAMDDSGALRQDLRRLASLAPDHRWGREAPPELGEAFAQTLEVVDGVLGVTSDSEGVPGGVSVSAEAVNDHGGLVRELRIFTRVGGGSWHRTSGGTQAAPAGQRLEYYVEAIGPGGAVLATEGSRDEPLESGPALAGGSLVRADDDDDGGGVSPWVWIGIGAGVLVAAGVVLAILLVGNAEPSGTQPESPLVIGF
jgi:hypothetical protein